MQFNDFTIEQLLAIISFIKSIQTTYWEDEQYQQELFNAIGKRISEIKKEQK